MKNKDSYGHVRGESLFLDDINVRQGTLYGLVFDSPVANGKILNVDYSNAEKLAGVERILTYKDIPGENQIGAIIRDESLFAEKEVHFIGQPIAFILAKSLLIAKKQESLSKLKLKNIRLLSLLKKPMKKVH